MLKNAFNTTQSLNHIRSVVVQIPQFSVVPLMRPPERVLLQDLVGLELRSHSPTFIVGQRVAVLLEERVNAGNTTVPAVVQIFEG